MNNGFVAVETASARDRLAAAPPEITATRDPDDVIRALALVPATTPYSRLPPSVTRTWDALADAHGPRGLAVFNMHVMLRLIEAFEPRGGGVTYTRDIIARFARSYNRILSNIADPDFAGYDSINDKFLKDLALCRRAMFPAGARLVEPDSGFHRAMMFRGGPAQALRMVRLLLRTGGNDRWFMIHTHLWELEDFTPDGWIACCRRLAGMLVENPHVRGIYGGSWFYDPALADISPRLAYVLDLPRRNGAFIFFSHNETKTSGALSRSPTRRAAFEAGHYQPRSYAMIWPRRALIDWAELNDP